MFGQKPARLDELLHPSQQLPLYGKRIIVTAPRNYAARLSQHLIVKGGLPILMPAIETCRLEDFAELDTALRRIREFDRIAFTSRSGIDAFCQRMQELELSPSSIAACHICAIGRDAERLTDWGIAVDLIPQEPSPMGIVMALAAVPERDRKTILVPVPEVVGIPEPDVVPNFVAGLEHLGLLVTRVPAYLTRRLDKRFYNVELSLLQQGKIDAIAFSSAAEVVSFLTMTDSLQGWKFPPIACFGPYTAAHARKLGLDVNIIAQDYSSFEGFADAIAAFFTTALHRSIF